MSASARLPGPALTGDLLIPGTVLPACSIHARLATLHPSVRPPDPSGLPTRRPRLILSFRVKLTLPPSDHTPLDDRPTRYHILRLTLRCSSLVREDKAAEKLEQARAALHAELVAGGEVGCDLQGLRVAGRQMREKSSGPDGKEGKQEVQVELEGEGGVRILLQKGKREILVGGSDEVRLPEASPEWAKSPSPHPPVESHSLNLSTAPRPPLPISSNVQPNLNLSAMHRPPVPIARPVPPGSLLPDSSAFEAIDTGLRPLTSLAVPPRPPPMNPSNINKAHGHGHHIRPDAQLLAASHPAMHGRDPTGGSAGGGGGAGGSKRPQVINDVSDAPASKRAKVSDQSDLGQGAVIGEKPDKNTLVSPQLAEPFSGAALAEISDHTPSVSDLVATHQSSQPSPRPQGASSPSLPERIITTQGIPEPPAGQRIRDISGTPELAAAHARPGSADGAGSGERPTINPTEGGVKESAVQAARRNRAEAIRREKERRERELQEEEEERREAMRSADELRNELVVPDLKYTPLALCRNYAHYNLIAIVVESKPIRPTKRDFHREYILTDPSLFGGDELVSDDMVCSMFRPREGELPELSRGTAVLVRGVKTSKWNDKVKGQLFSNDSNTLVHLRPYPSTDPVIPEPTKLARPLLSAEVQRMVRLRDWWAALQGGHEHASAKKERLTYARGGAEDLYDAHGKHGERTLNEMGIRGFYDFTFKVLDIIPNHSPSRDPTRQKPALELYVTDGTVCKISTNNFHNVDHSYPEGLPPSAVVCVSIFERPPPEEESMYAIGSILKMVNVRTKSRNDGLEIAWSEEVTSEQMEQNFRRKRLKLIDPEHVAAREINRRLKDWRNGRPQRPPGTGSTGAPGSTTKPSVKQSPAGDRDPFLGQHPGSETKMSTSATSYSLPPVAQIGSPVRSDANAALLPVGGRGYTHRSRPDAPSPSVLPSAASAQPTGPKVYIPEPHPVLRKTTPSPRKARPSEFLMTTYTDPVLHRTSTLEEVLSCRTVPNKFRVKARVRAVVPHHMNGKGGGGGGAGGGGGFEGGLGEGDKTGLAGLAAKYCKKCCRTFITDFCKSCNDQKGINAEWRWRFLIILEEAEGDDVADAGPVKDGLPVLVCDEEAAEFLPSLPPLSTSSNPNDHRKTQHNLSKLGDIALRNILGRSMDGVRERPIIDWTLMGYWLDVPKGRRGGAGPGAGRERVARDGSGGSDGRSEKDEKVLAWRVFGMHSKDRGFGQAA